MEPFSISYRNAVSEEMLSWARNDSRISAAAVVGSLADGLGYRWSDLDLAFAVADGVDRAQVLVGWTEKLYAKHTADVLFDVSAGESLYRVFLLPGFLQLDLSFTPQSGFVQQGSRFSLVFGAAPHRQPASQPDARVLLGYAAHHLLRARICIERGRFLQAEYWLHAGRDYALNVACLGYELSAAYGRGFDQLPSEVTSLVPACLVARLDKETLLLALRATVDLLLRSCSGSLSVTETLRTQLSGLTTEWDQVR